MKNNSINFKIFILVFFCIMSIAVSSVPVYANEHDEDISVEKAGLEELEEIEISDAEADELEAHSDAEVSLFLYGRNWAVYGNDYIRNNMNSVEQKFYDELDTICRKYMDSIIDAQYSESKNKYVVDGISYSGIAYERARDIVFMYLYQNPQYYFLESAVLYNSKKEIIWPCCYGEFANGLDRYNVTEQVFDKIDAWLEEIDLYDEPLDKEKKAHDIVCENVVYNTSAKYNQSAYSSIMLGESVCAGYAKLFSILMNASGIQTVGITGSSHAWNKVLLYGKWYNVDTTWDDNGSYIRYTYFNKSDQDIKSGHIPFTIYNGLMPDALENFDSSKVRGIKFDKNTITLTMGEKDTDKITADVSPSSIAIKTMSWSSSNNNVVKVTDGNITAVGIGEADVIATVTDGVYTYTAVCEVKVYKKSYNPPALTLKEKSTTSITLNEIKDCVYSRDGVIWQDSTTFNGLMPNRTYTFYAKKIATGYYLESDCSEGTSFTTASIDAVPVTEGIYVSECNYKHIVAGMVTKPTEPADIEYRWLAYETAEKKWMEIQGWTLNNEWLNWTPDTSGNYVIVAQARVVGNEDKVVEASTGVEYHKCIKGKCQMPYNGPGGGYLIGVESYDNPNQSYRYEMLILDCTLLAKGEPAWIYTTGQMQVSEGNALWTIWQPQYGYYWTLFRVFDENGKMLDEECYGFVNAY